MIDPAKTYRTRDGREVRIYAVDGGQGDKVHGAVNGYVGATKLGWEVCSWYNDGTSGLGKDFDLIEVKTKHVRWVNVYEVCGEVYTSKYFADADDQSRPQNRLACIRIEFEEGEGL